MALTYCFQISVCSPFYIHAFLVFLRICGYYQLIQNSEMRILREGSDKQKCIDQREQRVCWRIRLNLFCHIPPGKTIFYGSTWKSPFRKVAEWVKMKTSHLSVSFCCLRNLDPLYLSNIWNRCLGSTNTCCLNHDWFVEVCACGSFTKMKPWMDLNSSSDVMDTVKLPVF